MAQIKIPPYNWFINKSDNKPVTNVYTGSCDTEAKKVQHTKQLLITKFTLLTLVQKPKNLLQNATQ